MKKYIGLSLMALGLAFSSCDDFLDEMPDNRATIDNEDKVTSLLVSAYPTAYFSMLTELYSDNIDNETNPTYTTYTKMEDEAALWQDITYKDEDGDSPYAIWNACYLAAGAANEALQAIENMGNPASLQAQKGEALMCRAYAHWILVNVFSKHYNLVTSKTDLGITYSTIPETALNPKVDRGTVAEVYEKIAADIEEALPLMNDGYLKVPKYHFNRKAAYAFAARFYLQYTQEDKSNYDKVIEYANVVLGPDASASIRDWATVGAKAINGSVRAMAFTDASDRANLMLLSTYSIWVRVYGPYSLGYKYCHDQVISQNETTARNPWGTSGTLNFTIPQYQGMPKIIMAKTAEYFEYSDPVNGIGFAHEMMPAFTTDEVLLNRAEAYVMKGDYAHATEDLNTWGKAFYRSAPTNTEEQIASFYEDMDYYTPTEPTPKKKLNPDYTIESGKQENFIHAVLVARRILLLHEGMRWFDVKRFGIDIYRRAILNNRVEKVIDELKKDDPRRAIQLPQSVIHAGVTANPR